MNMIMFIRVGLGCTVVALQHCTVGARSVFSFDSLELPQLLVRQHRIPICTRQQRGIRVVYGLWHVCIATNDTVEAQHKKDKN